MNNEDASRSKENNKKWNYIGVIFENKTYPFDSKKIVEDSSFRNSIYGNSTCYTYKTKNDFNVGQVLEINQNRQETSRVLVVKNKILEESLTFPIEKIKELPLI